METKAEAGMVTGMVEGGVRGVKTGVETRLETVVMWDTCGVSVSILNGGSTT